MAAGEVRSKSRVAAHLLPALLQFLFNSFQHSVQVFGDFAILKANHSQSLTLDVSRPFILIHVYVVREMCFAIQFDR